MPTGRGRGRGFVEFVDEAAATAALELSGSILMQRPITVSPSLGSERQLLLGAEVPGGS